MRPPVETIRENKGWKERVAKSFMLRVAYLIKILLATLAA